MGKIGPQTLALLDNVSREQVTSDMTVEIAGYEGEWFDAGDVQGYLEEKGIFISPAATFAEAEIAIDSPLPLQIESSASTTSSSVARTPDLHSDELRDVSIFRMPDTTAWDDMFSGLPLSNVGYSDAETGSFMNFLQPGEAIKKTTLTADAATISNSSQALAWADDWMGSMAETQEVQAPTTRTKKVVIDVRKLIKGTRPVVLRSGKVYSTTDVQLYQRSRHLAYVSDVLPASEEKTSTMR